MEKVEQLKKYLRIFGIMMHNPNGCKYIVDIAINCLILTFLLLNFLASSWFLAFDAQTFNEFSESIFYFLSLISIIAFYIIYIWQSHKYAKFFADLDAIIENSKKLLIYLVWGNQNIHFSLFRIRIQPTRVDSFYQRI